LLCRRFFLIGIWVVRHRTVANVNARLILWGACGALSIVWVTAWLDQHNGGEWAKPDTVWNLALELPYYWGIVLIVLVVVWTIRTILDSGEQGLPVPEPTKGAASISVAD
jgi:hypothetical protein